MFSNCLFHGALAHQIGNAIIITSLISSLTIAQVFNTYTRTGSNIECLGSNACANHTILCDSFIDCTIQCLGFSACLNTRISCPKDANCLIQCDNGRQSCQHMTVNATDSSSLEFQCDPYSIDSCDSTAVYCPINGHRGPISCNITGISSSTVSNAFDVCFIL